MQTVVKTKVELRHREDGRPVWVEVPYEKTVLDDEDKMRIVSEYVQSREPAQMANKNTEERIKELEAGDRLATDHK